LFDSLDLEDFDSQYVSQGQAAKEPRLVLRTLFYALTHGMISGRKLQDACRNDNRYTVLSGDTRPDRRTFDRFLKRHQVNFDLLFKQVVRLAQEMNLVKLGRVAIDGSKFKGRVGKNMRYDAMCRAMEHIGENLDKLRADLAKSNSDEANVDDCRLQDEIRHQEYRRELIKAAKARVERENAEQAVKAGKKQARLEKSYTPLHEPDAMSLGMSAKFPFGYNVQAAVDDTSQIVVAAELHANQSDQGALAMMLDAVADTCARMPAKTLADSGYNSLKNLDIVTQRKSEAIIAMGREYSTVDEHQAEQVRKGDGDRNYYCLADKELDLACRSSDGHLSFRMSESFCQGCVFIARCRLKGKKTFQIPDDEPRERLVAYLEKSRGEDFKADYRRRKVIVEPVFGNIKNKGMRILVRGKKAVGTWWKMACTAHNIEKILKSEQWALT
jgi:transposase